ncbi:MAG: AAA family ATPase [Planctomycetaceae bacterium]|nr:AAA family ATPase [Planctomycetaceae bacterium]
MSIHDYIGYPLVAWSDYNRNPIYLDKNTRCYISPRLSDKTGVFEPVQVDRIEVELYQNVEPFYKNVGALVEIRMLDAPSKNTNPNSSNPYFMWYSKSAGKTGIVIEQYKGDALLQVVRTPNSIDAFIKTHVLMVPPVGILTKRILLECNGMYYGPFEHAKIDEHSVRISSRKDDRYYIGKYFVENFVAKLLPMTENFGGLDLIDARHLPPLNNDNKVDFFSDTELRDFFLSSLDIKSREQMEKLRTFFKTVDDQIVSADREHRIGQILRNVEYQDTTLRQIAYYVLASKDLCETVMDKIIKERLDVVLRSIPEGGIKISDHAVTAPSEADPAAIEVSRPEADPEAELQVAERKALLLRLNKKYDALLEKVNLADDIDHLRAETESAQSELKTATAAVELAQKSLEHIREEAKGEAKFIADSVDKSFLDLVLRTLGDQEWEDRKVPPFSPALLSSESRPPRIIDRVLDAMQRANRTLPGDDTGSRNEVANYLICLTQGFITTFAGDPGTGKTSLCHLLAKALGLVRDDDNNRFVEVSVERGWTSHKDFIGYYNPLSKSMEISNREVFSALTVLDGECRRRSEEIAPFFMLLDEANLSPLEHYWAAFLRICDFDSASVRSVNMGGQSILQVPTHLRFLATVNFDHTTEELSPRFIDRSWIITLSPEDINTNPVSLSEPGPAKVISFPALMKAFAPKDQKFDPTILEEWNAIQTIFSSNKLPIFPRNLKMVRNYFQVAFSCMDTSREENRFAPLDYAVSQKILPTLNGTGEKYGGLVDALLTRCSGKLPLCQRHLLRIQEAAENNLGFYQFFTK